MSAHLGSSTAQEAIHPTDNDVLFSSSDSETDTDDPPRGGDANDGEEIPRTTIADTQGPYHVLIEVLNGPLAGYLDPLPRNELVRASANQFYEIENRNDEDLRDAVFDAMTAVDTIPQHNLVPYGRFVTIVDGSLVQVSDAEAFLAVKETILSMLSGMEARGATVALDGNARSVPYAPVSTEHPLGSRTMNRRISRSLSLSSSHWTETLGLSGGTNRLKTSQPQKNTSVNTQETAASTVASRSDFSMSAAMSIPYRSDHSKGSAVAQQEDDESVHHERTARRPS